MIEKPIIFSGPMVRAILAGNKTQTRRIFKNKRGRVYFCPLRKEFMEIITERGFSSWQTTEKEEAIKCPYGKPGDRLWVRENFALHDRATDLCKIVYQASVNESWTEAHEVFPAELSKGMKVQPFQRGWKPSIHLPRWASRILLEITDIRVERLQDISKGDVIAEGITEREGCPIEEAVTGWHEPYAELWESINGKGSWDANPWVWVVAFKRVNP